MAFRAVESETLLCSTPRLDVHSHIFILLFVQATRMFWNANTSMRASKLLVLHSSLSISFRCAQGSNFFHSWIARAGMNHNPKSANFNFNTLPRRNPMLKFIRGCSLCSIGEDFHQNRPFHTSETTSSHKSTYHTLCGKSILCRVKN